MTGFKRTTMWNADHTHGGGLQGCDCYTKLARYEDSEVTPEQVARYRDAIIYADQHGIPQSLILTEMDVFGKMIKSITDAVLMACENISSADAETLEEFLKKDCCTVIVDEK